ncbi:DUF2007 domain-containing protein [Shewanella sp. 202IG2-18]|uniref:putative signal transducing protein n=1 Tax=Parashewanella hymeniacidonis TaxID=2807618 RepID=UPI00195FB266|nr:DUF2007 domain-containing protein [Parashewanella hymeniacidonis]MBM7071655.1 DUF2007 domain-containing protein [Parashewanella hymeniacidonis]
MSDKCLLAKGTLIEIHAWKGLLETQDIEVELKGEALLGATGEFGLDASYAEVWVKKDKIDHARNILDSMQQQGESWCCRECGEKNESNFELCWQCGTEAPE